MNFSTAILFYLSITFGFVVSLTTFEVMGTWTCNNRGKNWCIYVELLEKDLLGDDLLDRYGSQCTFGSVLHFKLEGFEYGDELLSKSFEIFTRTRHNCSEYDVKEKIYYEFFTSNREVPLNVTEFKIQYEPRDITRRGDIVNGLAF